MRTNLKMIAQPGVPNSIFANHIAILGKTGSGKTYTAKGFVETLLLNKERICIIDPTNVWWGLRSSEDGRKARFPVVVFGGDHADMPLLPNSGIAIAEIVGGTDINAILVTKFMSVRERTQFFTDFAEGIMRTNKNALHLLIDEAHNFMPQGKVMSPQAGAMLAAGNELLSGGRACGLRITLISQRPQKLHKDSLTQAETLIAMRLIAPHDRKAVAEWMEAQAEDDAHAKDILKSLPGLKTGEGWIWSPECGLLKKMVFPRIATFDSSAAPNGKGKKVVLAAVDMKAIGTKLDEYVKQADDNDPKKLKKKILELQNQHAISFLQKDTRKQIYLEGMKAGLEEGRKKGNDETHVWWMKEMHPIMEILKRMEKRFSNRIKSPIDVFLSDLNDRVGSGSKVGAAAFKTDNKTLLKVETTYGVMPKKPVFTQGGMPAKRISNPGSVTIGAGQRKILVALAQCGEEMSKRKIAILAGYAHGGGSFNTYLSGLRTAGYIVDSAGIFRITSEGQEALGPYEPLPTGEALQSYWLSQLGKGEAAILKVLIDNYPTAISKEAVGEEAVGEEAGYNAAGGSFNTYLSKLRTLDLIKGKGMLVASEDLFDGK